MRKTLFVSIKRLKMHEFNTTMRILVQNDQWAERFLALSRLQSQAIQAFLKSTAPLVAAYFILRSLNSAGFVGITFQGVSAKVPTAYFSISSSILYFFSMISLCHLSTIMSLREKQSGKILINGFSANAYGLINGFDENALGIPILPYRFLRELLPASTFLTLISIAAFFSLLAPLLAFGAFLTDQQYSLIGLDHVSNVQKIIAAGGIAISISAILYPILFHLPLPMRKNKEYIRWGFLWRISINRPHPRAAYWTNKAR